MKKIKKGDIVFFNEDSESNKKRINQVIDDLASSLKRRAEKGDEITINISFGYSEELGEDRFVKHAPNGHDTIVIKLNGGLLIQERRMNDPKAFSPPDGIIKP